MTNLEELKNVPSTLSRVGEVTKLAAEAIEQLQGTVSALEAQVQSETAERNRLRAELARLQGEKPPVDPPVEPVPEPIEPPPPPDKPTDKVPDIRIEVARAGESRVLTLESPGERWNQERRWLWNPQYGNAYLRVLLDVHDSGQVRISLDRADWRTPVSPNTPLVLDVTVDIDGKRRHQGKTRVHHHTTPTIVFDRREAPRLLPQQASSLVDRGFLPRYPVYGGAVPETDLAAIAAGKYPWETWTSQAARLGNSAGYDPISEQYESILRSFTGGAGALLNEAAMVTPVQAVYLLSRDPRAWAQVVQDADSSGNYGVHCRLPDDRYPLPHETGDMPQLNTDPPVTLYTAAGGRLPIPDVAHQHSLVYLAYLLTGERFYFEQLQAWATYNLLTRPKNQERLRGLLYSGELRATAWAIRSLLHLVLATDPKSDGFLRVSYEDQLRYNLRWLTDRFTSPSSPDYRPTGIVHVNPWRSSAMLQFVRAEPKPQWTATWMHHVLAFVLNECARAGFDEAVPARDHLLRVAEGCWRHAPSKHLAAWGNHVMPADPGIAPSAQWAAAMAATFEGMTASSPHRTAFTSPLTSDYVAWFRAAVVAAADAGQPWATEALQWLDKAVGESRWKSVPLVWKVMPQ